MRALTTTMKKNESKAKEYTLSFPENEKGNHLLREWLLLKLVFWGYETLDISTLIYGKFPRTVKIRTSVEETEEMKIVLKKYCEANGVRIEN